MSGGYRMKIDEKYKAFAHPSQYPEIKVQSQNPYYAELLIDNFAGPVSEMSAAGRYMYQHFLTDEESEELASTFKGIGVIEMLHMETLAELIIKLGGNPIFRGSESTNFNFWSAGFVYYGCNLYDRLLKNIEIEQAVIANYHHKAMLIDDPYVKAVLQRIALDEEVHVKIFTDILQKIT